MDLKKTENIYFVGIGGIGMSAIARYFAVHGKNVAGYDKVATPITDALLEIDVAIHFEDAIKNIPLSFLNKEVTVSGKISHFRNKYQITNPNYVSENASIIKDKHNKYSLHFIIITLFKTHFLSNKMIYYVN